jgi:hypothetical protein
LTTETGDTRDDGVETLLGDMTLDGVDAVGGGTKLKCGIIVDEGAIEEGLEAGHEFVCLGEECIAGDEQIDDRVLVDDLFALRLHAFNRP